MKLRHHIVLACLAWTVAAGASATVWLNDHYAELLESKRAIARMAFDKDITFRRWNALRGGVYVAVSETTRPNPYLDVPERDILSTHGLRLTLVNPAYMTRQAHELQRQTMGVQAHITSLRPIRPGNAPDEWERQALEAFERGEKEFSSIEVYNGQRHMRLMRPMMTEKPCLKCHAKQGYREGEVRGGISVAVPMEEQLAGFRKHVASVIGGHGLVWALGMAGLIVGGGLLGKSLREAERSRAAAVAASQSKSEFLANMSHEIRTPLNGVLGMLQLLRGPNSPEERESYVELAYDAGRRLLSLLNDVLDFSRMEAGGLTLQSEPFSLGEVFGSVENLFKAICADKRLELSFRVDASVPATLKGDEARLRQVLFNLVGNGVKFTPSGSVRVSAWARPGPAPPGAVTLYVEVADTGIGIPADKLGHIFDRFTQADGSYTRRFEGAGLGLAIVRRIVQLMGGGLSVDTGEGEGTTIVVRMKLESAIPDADAPSGGEHRPEPEQGRLRILLVEDEPVSKLSTQLLLSRLGHDVVTAANGFEAVALHKNGHFDCVLMDVQMPEMDGVEATHVIRSVEKMQGRPRMPIIALTAYAMSGDRERFLAEGMDAHVGKPVQMADLLRSLRKVRTAGGA